MSLRNEIYSKESTYVVNSLYNVLHNIRCWIDSSSPMVLTPSSHLDIFLLRWHPWQITESCLFYWRCDSPWLFLASASSHREIGSRWAYATSKTFLVMFGNWGFRLYAEVIYIKLNSQHSYMPLSNILWKVKKKKHHFHNDFFRLCFAEKQQSPISNSKMNINKMWKQ